jgi:hypothetical protein
MQGSGARNNGAFALVVQGFKVFSKHRFANSELAYNDREAAFVGVLINKGLCAHRPMVVRTHKRIAKGGVFEMTGMTGTPVKGSQQPMG